MKKNDVRVIGGIGEKKSNGGTQFYEQDRVYDIECLATSIPTSFHPNYLTHTHTQESKMSLRIRKLVPVETTKLMGFERKDYQAMRDIGQSDMQIYHECGDALVTTVFAMIIGVMLPMGEQKAKEIVENYIESLIAN